MSGWSVMVGLIGSGQEIFRGEEQGMVQWNKALKKMPSPWIVHCPSLDAENNTLGQLFTAAASVKINEALGLNRSLRSHLALDLPTWANSLLTGDIARAASLAPEIRSAGFNLYVTTTLKRQRLMRDRGMKGMRKVGTVCSPPTKIGLCPDSMCGTTIPCKRT